MTELLSYLWQFNIELSLLMCVILLARLVIRKTTKNYNAYLLWLSIPIGLGIAKLISTIEFQQPPTETVSLIINSYLVKPSQSMTGWEYLLYVWLVVAGLLLFRLLLQHKKLRHDLKSISVPHNLTINARYPIIGINKGGFSPAVYGFVKPKIYFPIQLESKLSKEQIELIIKHEEHHISQKHLWLNLLWDIVVCLVWFNPLVYISRQNFRHDQEVYCDYLVLNRAPEPEHKTYGQALLSTVSATHSVSLLCSWKMFNQLEERIMSIKNVKKTSNKIALAIGGLAIVGCTSLYAINMNSFKQLDKNGDYKVEWTIDDKSFVQKDGEWQVYENGKVRPLTIVERRNFEKHVEMAEEEMQNFVLEMAKAEEEMARSAIELEESMQSLKEFQIKTMIDSLEVMNSSLEETKIDHENLKLSLERGKLTDKDLEVLELELKRAKEYIEQNQGQYRKELNRLRKELEESQKQLKQKHLGLTFPLTPKESLLSSNAYAIPVSTFPADYPKSAVENRIEGFSRMSFDLDKSGAPYNIKVIESSPGNLLDEVSIDAVEKWRFKTDGSSKSDMRYTLEFKLKKLAYA